MNTDHRLYPRCRRRRRLLHLQKCGGVEKAEMVEVGAEVVEVVHGMNCHSVSTRNSYTRSSSSAPLTISTASTATYPPRGAHIVSCTSCRLLELPLHQLIQCIDLITDGLWIDPSKPNSRHKAWRV